MVSRKIEGSREAVFLICSNFWIQKIKKCQHLRGWLTGALNTGKLLKRQHVLIKFCFSIPREIAPPGKKVFTKLQVGFASGASHSRPLPAVPPVAATALPFPTNKMRNFESPMAVGALDAKVVTTEEFP